MKENYLNDIITANKKLGILSCSEEIFLQLESFENDFLDDLLNALVQYTLIEEDCENKFARYDTCMGNIVIFTKKEEDDKTYTNIIFTDEF